MSTKLELLPSSCGRRSSSKSVPECSEFTLKSLRFFSIKPILDERPLVLNHLRKTSVVYARKTPPLVGTRLGQRQVTQLRLKDWSRYNWTLPKLPACRRPLQRPSPPPPPRLERREAPLQVRDRFVRGSGDGGKTSARSLPPLGRSPLGQPMLRRPTTHQSLREGIVGDELLHTLGNYLDLKPVSDFARGPNKLLLSGGSARFYNQHFPLLLEKKTFRDEEPTENNAMSHRQIAGRLPNEQKRRADLMKRCHALERALTSLERGADDMEEGDHLEDGVFITELREDTFDPMSWPWNAERYHGQGLIE